MHAHTSPPPPLPSPPLCPAVGPVWLKNLYFAYLLVLRAVTKAEPLLQHYAFYTGNTTEDEDTKAEVMKIVQSAKYEGGGGGEGEGMLRAANALAVCVTQVLSQSV